MPCNVDSYVNSYDCCLLAEVRPGATLLLLCIGDVIPSSSLFHKTNCRFGRFMLVHRAHGAHRKQLGCRCRAVPRTCTTRRSLLDQVFSATESFQMTA